MSAETGRTSHAAPGDWIEEPDVGSERGVRRGLILEVLGRPGHPHYRVRWDEEHEAVHFPSPSARVVADPSREQRRR
jgi:hypothetical protein